MQYTDMQIAGGSGITPMLQVASEIVNNPEDKTQVSLIFANQTEKDIILKEEIDEMAAKHDNFQVVLVCIGCTTRATLIMHICFCLMVYRNLQKMMRRLASKGCALVCACNVYIEGGWQCKWLMLC